MTMQMKLMMPEKSTLNNIEAQLQDLVCSAIWHLHTFTYIYIHLHTFTYIYIHLHTFTYIYIHLHTFTYIYIHLHTFTYIYQI